MNFGRSARDSCFVTSVTVAAMTPRTPTELVIAATMRAMVRRFFMAWFFGFSSDRNEVNFRMIKIKLLN